jgi:hypothetical protein
MKELQEQNNVNLGLNTDAINANTAALQSAAQQPNLPSITTPGSGNSGEGSVTPQTAASAVAGVNATSSAVGALGETAKQTAKQADEASKTGKENFSKFTGAMVGVATGALAITGAIQAMQQAESGTYGTLMGIAGVLGGLGSIFGGIAGLGKKAAGGPVSARRPYIVGEVGPELFVPESSGTIIPNDRLAFTGSSADGAAGESSGGMMLPFQQGGSSSVSNAYQGNSSSVSNAFSTLYGASIPFTKSTERALSERSERETVAAINNPKPLDVRFESQVINNIEYVTAEQHQRGMAQAAERGRALTLQALQNNVTSRRKVGIA